MLPAGTVLIDTAAAVAQRAANLWESRLHGPGKCRVSVHSTGPTKPMQQILNDCLGSPRLTVRALTLPPAPQRHGALPGSGLMTRQDQSGWGGPTGCAPGAASLVRDSATAPHAATTPGRTQGLRSLRPSIKTQGRSGS